MIGFPETRAGQEILRVEDAQVTFGDFKAINGLTFSVDRGELRVVIGPNGAGKTTLLDVITGKTRLRSGHVWFHPSDRSRTDITRMAEARIARLGVGRKFQTPNVFGSLNVLENLKLALKYPRGVFATLAAPFVQDGRSRVEEVLEIIGLTAKRFRAAGTLAHGEKQWLELGMLMAQDPELLLIDEPVAGMTPRESERTGELLLAMARKHTLLVIDHDMTFVRQIASRVTVLHEGQLLCQGRVDEVQRDPRVIDVYLGEHKDEEASVRPGVAGRTNPGVKVAQHAVAEERSRNESA